MTDLATLVVKLSAETSEFSAAIKQSTAQIENFSTTIESSLSNVAKNIAGLYALKEAFDFTDNIAKTMASFELLSHAVGVTSASLSELSFAAKLEGVEDIGFPLERMARSVGAAEQGNQKLINTFKALGVSITDASGRIKSTDQLFLDISDAVSKYNDGLSKTAAVQAIFGRSGADFVGFLNEGSQKIKEAKQEAIDLGVSVSTPTAQAALEFEQNMTRIGAAFKGVFYKALQDLLPALLSLTESIVEFSKNSSNTSDVVQGLVAGFKIIGSVLVIVGTAFEVVGKTIGIVTAEIVQEINALVDLAKAFTDPIGAIDKFTAAQRKNADELANLFLHPVDSAKAFVKDTKKNFDDLADTVEHPINALKRYAQAQIDAFKDSGAGDVLGSVKNGASALASIWGNLDDQLNYIQITAKKIKPDLILIDQTGIKALEKAIDSLAALDDKLKQEIATFGLSGAAATVYDVTLGKLSASVDELNKAGTGKVQEALAQLEKQGKLTKEQIDQINTAIKAGVPPGEAFADAIIADARALEQLKAVDALSKLDSQLLTMTGHIEDAGKAAFDLAQRPLRITIQTEVQQKVFAGLDQTDKVAEAQTQLNALRQQAIDIEDALGKKVAAVDAAGVESGKSNLQVAGEEAVARQAAIAQLEALFVKAQALANATGLKSAVEEAKSLRDAIGAIQFNPKIIDDVDRATQAQKRFNDLLNQEKQINDDLSLQLADLSKQNSQGALTDLDYMFKQDDARQAAIDRLKQLQEAEEKVLAENPGNPAALDQYKKLAVQIDSLQTQMNQLAKTIRTDITDDLSKAFVDFATGAKSAKDALKEFVLDFNKQMLDLAAKHLFQKLFETTGISSAIDSLFTTAKSAVLPAAASSVTGAAGNTAAATASATAISTAMTTAATAGAASLGTGITTAATAGATALGTGITGAATAGSTEMATGITTAGTAAATEMGVAITTAGSEAAAAMAAAIATSSTGSEIVNVGVGAAGALALAIGGPVPASQLALVGEEGPELFVSDLGPTTAAVATAAGTTIPDDLTYAHVIGADGPEYIRPNVSGFVVPSDVFLTQLSDRTTPQVPSVAAGPIVRAEPVQAEGDAQVGRPVASQLQVPEQAPFVRPEAEPTVPKKIVESVPFVIAPPVVELSGTVLPPQVSRLAPAAPLPTQAGPDVRAELVEAEVARLGVTRPPNVEQGVFRQPETTRVENVPADVVRQAHDAPVAPEPAQPALAAQQASNVIAFPARPPRPPSETLLSQLDERLSPPVPEPLNTDEARAPERTTATNVVAFPKPSLPATSPEFVTAALGAAITPPSAPERPDAEVTRASAPEISVTLDEPTSAMIVKFEKVVKHEQSRDTLDAHEYEAMLTDRYLQKRQGGGPVAAGKPYLVGESGPELMVPDSSGTIMNSWESDNKQSVVNNVTNHFVINTPTGKVDRASQGQIAARTALSVQAASGRNN